MTLTHPHSRVALAAMAVLAFSPLAGPALAQVQRPAAPAAAAAAPPVAAKPAPRPARSRPAPGYRTVYSANAHSRDLPASGAYVNAALYYAFEPGRLYTVNTSPRFLTVIALRPGEKLISKAAGDTVRWVLGETVQGSGVSEQVLVMLKPTRGSLRTNVILTTDQRTYLLEAVSREGEAYTSVVNWTYALDEAREAQAAKAADARGVVASGLAVDQLHFDYDIRPIKSKSPNWQPLRVFDDGLKTYIQFPTNLGASEAPPLFVIGADRQAQLVNYRYLNGYYVVDRLIDVAELRLGEKRQTVVRITRTGKRS
ncbi:type IV secretion system protein VirB9 [Phenylobacterium haematophilum]|jgi:P-type conjugative transfer protein TrbG|uniref:Type IV secretion system protein VirB9 n=1 Tax=Phenylobacterium haematophilum TaxID=98513 RepID=A0A840A3C6_9CAUL|nr:P-type conjugative transfer protein TrbG [Phenylobacterium haematophilum]MBB3892888.1 type IV secretion system protein VirB9 [Phenylobacterium haematophilum]